MDKEQAKSILRKVVNPDVREAIETLIPELNENEDERNWKAVLDCVKDDALKEWLKKQREQKPIISAEESLGISQEEYSKIVDECIYGEDKEQKPAWMKIDNSEKNVVFPFKARVKDSDKVVTIIDGQLSFDGKQWIKFASNRDDGFKVYCPEDLLVEQSVECIEFDNEFKNQVSHILASVLNKEWEYDKGFVEYAAQQLLGYAKHEIKSMEWSEKDELAFTNSVETLEYLGKFELADWLKEHKNQFLKPQNAWKPSEEQMCYLLAVINEPNNAGSESCHIILKSLYRDLKKLK